MRCSKCINCYKIALPGGGFSIFKRVSSEIRYTWFSSFGEAITDPDFVELLDSMAIPLYEFDCSLLGSGGGDINPVYEDPSAKIENECPEIYEVGAPIDIEVCITKIFDRGSILLNGNYQNPRSGDLDNSKSFLYFDDDSTNITVPQYVKEGYTCFVWRAYHGVGPQPVNMLGVPVDSPYPAGYIDSNKLCILGVAPFYATINTCERADKLPLILSDDKFIEFTLFAEIPGKQSFLVPNSRVLKDIYVFDAFLNEYKVTSKDLYDTTSEIITINGISVSYTIYTFNGFDRGYLKMKLELL